MIFQFIITLIFGSILAVLINIYVYDVSDLFESDLKNNGNDYDILLFTNEKLSQYDGSTEELLYLSILGNVYDVTKGKKHYGPGESYHAFIGRDASQSFVTGDFNPNNLSDDVSKLSGEELLSLEKWKEFYDKEYIKKGLLIGRYYDSKGNPTDYLKNIEKLINEVKLKKSILSDLEIKFPPCNIEWTADTGTRVWCTKQSGGIQRDWIGYPVKFYEPGSTSYRCACVQFYDDSNSIKFYDDCHLKTSCYVKND